MKAILQSIQEELKSRSNPATLASTQKFVPGSQKVYGVKMPDINDMAKRYQEHGFELIEALWKSGAYEEKVLAGKILGRIAKKDPERSIRMVESFSNDIHDWAVCDTIGMQSLKPIVKTHQKEIFALAKKLNRAESLWQRRLSLVLVEWYTRDKSLHAEILKLVKPLERDPEYYVKKAVEWIRRGISKFENLKMKGA